MSQLMFIMIVLFSCGTISHANLFDWAKYAQANDLDISDSQSQKHFDRNVHFIEDVSKFISFKLGETKFMHLSHEEFASMFYNISFNKVRNEKYIDTNLRSVENKNWVDDGCVTPVKDQGHCGSCWSFSTSGVMEGANCVKTGNLISLSEQQLVSCANKINMGCNGGNVDWTFHYLERNEHCSEEDYPYESGDGDVPKCHECKGAVDKVSEFVDVPKGDEDQLMKALLLNPVAVAIKADDPEFQVYKGGIMDFDCKPKLNHAVLAVGFGTEDGVDYWKIKNSWGTNWGEDGYFRLVRGKNMCGIAESASYPIL